MHEAEIYQPTTNSWATLSPAKIVRQYHSVALLMPDGRIWIAGSNKNASQSHAGGGEYRELSIDIFEPWYYCADRPQILSLPKTIGYGQEFEIHSSQAAAIRRIAIIYPGSCTHAFNSNQRYIGLTFRYMGQDLIKAIAPSNNVSMPGYYLIFVLNENGVPF